MGDEPYQIFKKHPHIALAVDADRVNGIQQILAKRGIGVLLMDDAFQHRKVTPNFAILLTTYENPIYKDYYLPSGTLRDDKAQIKRADIIVVTKCPPDLSKEEAKKVQDKLNVSKRQKYCSVSLDTNKDLRRGKIP